MIPNTKVIHEKYEMCINSGIATIVDKTTGAVHEFYIVHNKYHVRLGFVKYILKGSWNGLVFV